MHMASPRASPILSIQILRALAACLVVFGHSLHDAEHIAARIAQAPLDIAFLDWGFGVDIFFVISGFIMISTTAETFGRPDAARLFFQRRLIRIAPLYWLLTAGLIFVSFIAPNLLNVTVENFRSILTSYFFIPDVRGNGEVRPILALGWTLNYEMFFYAVFACCLMLPLRRGVLWLTTLFLLFSLLGAITTFSSTALIFWTDSIILEFLFGVFIALACRAGAQLPASAALALFGLGAALAVVLGPLSGFYQTLPHVLRAGVPATMIVAAAAFAPRLSATWIVAPLVALGDASYSLYLTHPFVVRPLRNVWMTLQGGMLPLGFYVLLCCSVAIIAALLVYRLIEKPMTGALQHWTPEARLLSRGPAPTLMPPSA